MELITDIDAPLPHETLLRAVQEQEEFVPEPGVRAARREHAGIETKGEIEIAVNRQTLRGK